MEDNLTTLVQKVAQLKQELAPLEARIKPISEALDIAKADLLLEMKQAKSKRTDTIDGYYVIRAERKSVVIADAGAVEDWLKDQGLNLDEYYKLDEKRVKATAESAMKEDGEIVPGIAVNTSEYLTIKDGK